MSDITVEITLHSALVVAGLMIISAYIIFGGPSHSQNMPSRKKRKRGLIPGLLNLGNTCFLNCIIQSLSSCSAFTSWILQESSNQSSQLPVLFSALKNLLNVLHCETMENNASANEVLRALRSHGWVISAEEQDAHELFHALLSTLYDEITMVKQQSNSLLDVSWLNEENKRNLLNINKEFDLLNTGNSTEFNADLLEFTSNKHLSERDTRKLSIVSKLQSSLKDCSMLPLGNSNTESPFKGYLASQLQCVVCGFKNAEQWSTFESLSLFLPSESLMSISTYSLHHLLDAFIRTEFVTDVVCDGCTKIQNSQTKTSFTKQLTIGKLPECLCIHIQRTVWLESNSAIKRRDFVTFPECINMEPYTYTMSINQKSAVKRSSVDLLGGSEISIKQDNVSEIPSTSIPLQKALSSLCHTDNASQLAEITSSMSWRNHDMYRLNAVVVHVGDIYNGHFVTYRRGPQDTSLRDKWFYTSDAVVREVSLSEVLRCCAYIIIYERFPTTR